MAFDLPFAAVDGNVLRVLARVLDDDGDIGSPVVRRRFQLQAQEILDARHPGDFNQAMMELGATVCLPRNPGCAECPVRSQCGAYASGRTAELPIKLRRHQPKNERVSVAVVRRGGLVLLRQRPSSAPRMAGFWELPGPAELPGLANIQTHGSFRHTIVHTVFEVEVSTGVLQRTPKGMRWTDEAHRAIPVTTISRKALALASSGTQSPNLPR